MVALAAVGVVCPQLQAVAAGPKSAVRTVAANSVLDIGLTQGGTFTGRVVDHTGAALEGATVVVKQGKTEVTRTITDKQGSFVATNLKGGVYTVASGATEGTYRVWTEKTAPPSANGQALLVLGQNNTRGQCGCACYDGTTVLLAAGVGLAAGIGIGYAIGWGAGSPGSP
ncbi:MAG: carboxypeptidase regulatory-like domain-containing protein [Candidatus Saccharimonas sp.]|nr:carboxypeptidase regulatory-like domain-containing protein [Planctomycetaceae bacterium]